eukprot:tig00001056_g6635.t1
MAGRAVSDDAKLREASEWAGKKSAKDLSEMLRQNGMKTTGTKQELAERVASALTFGVPPRCSCGGNLSHDFNSGKWLCAGKWNPQKGRGRGRVEKCGSVLNADRFRDLSGPWAGGTPPNWPPAQCSSYYDDRERQAPRDLKRPRGRALEEEAEWPWEALDAEAPREANSKLPRPPPLATDREEARDRGVSLILIDRNRDHGLED